MADLKTTYMGLELKNPLIVGASNLVTDTDNLKKVEDAGAAAIVYKSLFEEQIQLEAFEMEEQMEDYNERHAEMTSLFPDIDHAGPKEYLHNLAKARKAVKVPLLASLNCVYDVSWLDYAKKIAETGVDGIELNFYFIPNDFEKEGRSIVDEQLYVIKDVKEALNIPVSVKLSPYYTNMLYVIKQMDKAGADAFVLFNRLFQPEIDIEKEELHFPWNLSGKNDSRLPLRYAGLLYGNIDADICSNTGIYTAEDAIQMFLAGASTVQVVSTIYKHGAGEITNILKGITDWMNKKGYQTLSDFRGKLSRKNVNDPFAYKRAQYVDILWNSKDILNKTTL